MSEITIAINGDAEKAAAGTSLLNLLERKNLLGGRIAVERNGDIVPKSQYDAVRLEDGDRLEIVHAIGGG